VVAVALVAALGASFGTHPIGIGLAGDVVPQRAIDFATSAGLRRAMFSDFDVGSYLAWEGWPRWRVFEDARLPAYPAAFHRALDQTALAPAGFDRLLRSYGVDAVLVGEPGVNARAGAFDPDSWALVYRDPAALVFVRRIERYQALIAEREIPLRVRFRFVSGSWVEPLPSPPARSPVGRCDWSRRLAAALEAEARIDEALDARLAALGRSCLTPREEAEVRFYLGARLQQQGALAAAATEYDRVLAVEPDHTSALVNRGFARLRGDPTRARADFERALRLDPSRADARRGLERLR
jgi:tetratricopeptide (TPR) repeat protein